VSVSEYISVGVKDGVQTIRMVRPEKKNALNIAMYEALVAAFADGESDPSVRVRVIFGGEGIFTAGNDITDFHDASTKGVETMTPVLEFLRKLVFTEKPLIAAVDGLAIGIGTTLLLHCDLAYATHESAFVTPFIDLGLVPEAGSSLLAVQRMGYAGAFALLIAGKPLTAEAAVRAHLINAIVSRDTLENHTLGTAAKLVAKPPRALALSRRLLRGDPELVWTRIEEEARLFKECLASDEALKAFQAFMRRPTEATHQ
jgi:enoyl-CoA hydratase/carnithine racemase